MKPRTLLIGLCVLVVLPQFLGGYPLTLLTKVLIMGIFAMSLDLLAGYIMLPSFGHAAFFGTAAYTIGILASKKLMTSFWLLGPLALAASLIVAVLFGLLVLRTRSAYFFMITLALSQMLWGIAVACRSFTGGLDGIPGIARPALAMLPWSLQDSRHYFYFVLVCFVIAFAALRLIVRSPFGHILAGIRESEVRMRSLGYNIWLYKYVCYVIAALFAGFAGVLFVYFTGFVGPETLGVGLSAEALLMELFGGAGTLIGPVLGTGVIILLENIVSTYTQRWVLVMGILYVVVVMFTPKGILGLITKGGKRTV